MRRVFLAVMLWAGALRGLWAQTPDSTARLGLDSLLATPISTAAKYAQGVRQVAGSVTIVTAEDIRRFGYRTLSEVLTAMAGVYTSNPRSYESIGMRGFGRPTDYNNRILLLIDGHAVYESMWGEVMLGDEQPLNLAAVERIELIRGPASALYGTGAMFGIINVIPKRGADVAGIQVDGEAGNLGRRAGGFSVGVGAGERRSIALSGMYESTDGNRTLFYPEFNDPSTANGIVHNLDWQKRGGLTLKGGLGDFTLLGRLSYRRRGDPTAAYGMIFDDNRSQILDRTAFLELGFARDLSPTRHLAARVYYDNVSYQGFYPFADPDGFQDEGAVDHKAGGEATLRWDLGTRDRLTGGVEYRNTLRSEYYAPLEGARTTDFSRPFTVWSLYLQNELQLGSKLAVLAGVRHDESVLSHGSLTPRVALIYDPAPGTTLKAMYGRAFRAPNIIEAASGGPAGTGALEAETLDMFELLWIQRLSQHFLLTSSAYRYHAGSLIDVAGDSSVAGYLYYRNGETANATGLELTLDGRPSPSTSLYLNYSAQFAIDAEGADDGTWLTNSPRHMVKAGLASEVARGVTSAFELRYESPRKTLAGLLTDAFVVGNVNLTVHPFRVRSGLTPELGFRVANVFDTRYAYPGGVEHLQPAIGQDGRTFIVRLTARF